MTASDFDLSKITGNEPPLETNEDITCPFCGETDYDLIGLKSHLSSGDCDPYINTETVRKVFA